MKIVAAEVTRLTSNAECGMRSAECGKRHRSLGCCAEMDSANTLLPRIFHEPREMPTDRSAGILPAYVIWTLQAGKKPAPRSRRYEMSGPSGGSGGAGACQPRTFGFGLGGLSF